MRQFIVIFIIIILGGCSPTPQSTPVIDESAIQKNEFAIVVHGGAGYRSVDETTDAKTKAVIAEALQAGYDILKAGGSSQDAVVAAIVILEDSPLFNAGKGAVFTNEGRNELDASFMDGKTLNAGAVGGVTVVKNPIKAARAVMERSEHVFMAGHGAEVFAIEQGLDTVPNSYFGTARRLKSLKKAQKKALKKAKGQSALPVEFKVGTVGCVALDKQGNITAGTSTGGMTNKRYGRLGDVPVIGAGTYANNTTCGVSCTGHGEYFIRYAVAHDMSALMDYKGLDVKAAGEEIIQNKLKKAKGSGGLIAIDKYGRVVMPFNTKAMSRGYMLPDGVAKVYLYDDESMSSF